MKIKETLKELEGGLIGLAIYSLGFVIGVLAGWAMWGMR